MLLSSLILRLHFEGKWTSRCILQSSNTTSKTEPKLFLIMNPIIQKQSQKSLIPRDQIHIVYMVCLKFTNSRSNPLKLMVSLIGFPTYNIVKYLANILRKWAGKISSHILTCYTFCLFAFRCNRKNHWSVSRFASSPVHQGSNYGSHPHHTKFTITRWPIILSVYSGQKIYNFYPSSFSM